MSAPVVGTWAQRLYDRLKPIHDKDASRGYPFLLYIGAMGDNLMQQIEDLSVDQSDGTPGWSILLNPYTCPAYALVWLGQLVGVTVNPAYNEADQRSQIIAVGGWNRGSVASMLAAAKPFLTGTKFTAMVERYTGDPYQILYVTHTAETPTADPGLTAYKNAVIAQKPAGIGLTFATHVGQSWADMQAAHTTWTAVRSFYPTWNDVVNG